MELQWKILSSMEKVFPADEPKAMTTPLSGLMEEKIAFQVALFPPLSEKGYYSHLDVRVHVSSHLPVEIRQVGYIPCELPYFDNSDGGYLNKEAGLFPDPLYKESKGLFRLSTGRWNSFMIIVNTGRYPARTYPITLTIEPASTSYEKCSVTVPVEVIGKRLPLSDFEYTCWFHGDCLADYYQVPVFSDEHWVAMENQMKLAASYGQTMILTPLFTPPLDTAVGGERTTIQLVKVEKAGDGEYSFDFSLLDKFVAVAKLSGLRSFEMSHLYTQWGGRACPKIMATVNGEEKQIFGWNYEALSPEYQAFLTAFLPALTQHLDELDLRGHAVFHLTDEPHKNHLPQYKALKEFTEPLLNGYPVMDAMSDYDYFADGISSCPVVGTSALPPFLDGPRPERLWTYYCCSQGSNNLSNRFIAMPGARTRMIGVQCYLENIKGFLQWGLNFYNSQYSLSHIDPYKVTDADRSFPSGDPFIIYPGEYGEAIPSQRLILTGEAWQDKRALELLESFTSKEHVHELIHKVAKEHGFDKPITFHDYPASENFLTDLRFEVNQEIKLLTRALKTI